LTRSGQQAGFIYLPSAEHVSGQRLHPAIRFKHRIPQPFVEQLNSAHMPSSVCTEASVFDRNLFSN